MERSKDPKVEKKVLVVQQQKIGSHIIKIFFAVESSPRLSKYFPSNTMDSKNMEWPHNSVESKANVFVSMSLMAFVSYSI